MASECRHYGFGLKLDLIHFFLLSYDGQCPGARFIPCNNNNNKQLCPLTYKSLNPLLRFFHLGYPLYDSMPELRSMVSRVQTLSHQKLMYCSVYVEEEHKLNLNTTKNFGCGDNWCNVLWCIGGGACCLGWLYLDHDSSVGIISWTSYEGLLDMYLNHILFSE